MTVETINQRPVTTANAVGDYLVWFGQRHGDPLTNLKLQKLLYYAYGLFLAKNKRVLFGEPLRAWVRGPVVYEVWKEYKEYRWEPITCEIRQPKVPEIVEQSLYDLIDHYWAYSAYALETMTHQESPWLNARQGASKDTRLSSPISITDIYGHFSKLRHGAQKAASTKS